MGGFTLPLRGFLLLLLLAVLWVADRGRPIFAAATPQSSGGAGVRARRAQRKLKQSAEAVKASELGKELVDAVVEESGKPASEILPPGGEKALVTGLAVAEGIHVTQGPSDVVRVFGASLMRRLMALTGSWKLQELPDLDRVLITRTPPLGDERQGRSSACVSVTGFDASEKPAPIIFVNGLEFVQMLFMVMATMHQTSSLTATKDLLAFLPLLSTWRMVAQLQMLYYTFIAVPLDVALRMLEEEVLPSLHGDAKGEAEAKLTELRKISHSVRELAPPDVAPKDFTIQLDTSDSTEKAIVKACVKNDIPLVRYGTSSLFLKRALQNRSSFFQSLHKGGSEAEDIVGHLVQSAVTHYLDTHQRSLSVSEFMKPEFWENEDEAAVTLDQVLEMTNKAVQEAFLSVQERLEGHASSQELVHQLTSEYMTSEEAVKKLSTEFTGGITRAQKAIGEFYEKNDARGLCELLQNADTKEHPWISQLIYMYSELSKFCKKGQSFCQELLDCLQERPPKLTAAMETFEMIRLLQSILGSTTQGGAEALARSLSSELKAEAQKIEDIESAKEEEASRESRHAEQLSTSTSSEASSSEVKGAEGTSLKEGSADSVDSNAGSSGSIAASGISDETAGTPVLSEEARTFLADASNFRATLRMTDLGLVRASLQALRYYAMYRQLSTGALARLSSDCYFLEEQGAAQQELREASKFLPDLASHAVEASAKDAEASTSQSSSHHAFVERALAIQAPSVLGAAALRSGFALRDAWTSPSALSLVQASEALGTKRSKNGRGRKKKRSRKRKPKQKTKHLETSGAPPLQTVLRRHRAVSCFVLAAEAAHLLTQHPFFELKTSERAKTIFERTHQQMQSSWDNTLYAETADQRHLSSAIHSYGLAPLSLQTFLHTRETILSWLKKESTFLFEKCGDPAKHTLLPASHASDSLGHFSFSLQDLNGLQRLLMEVCEAIRSTCSHIAVRKDLPFMTTPLSLTKKIMRIPGDPAAVTAGGSAVVPLVTEMLQVIGNNDFGSTFDPLWNRVLAAGEVLRDSEHKSDELTKALEKVEKKRSKDLANINKSLRISTPVTQIKASFDRLGLRMWLASLTVAHTGLGSQKGKNRKVKLLTSRMQFAKGRLHVLECLEKHEALTEVAFLKASSPRHKPSSFKACPKPSPMPDQQALERIYDECLKADTSPAEKPKKKKGKFASHGKEVQKGGLGSDAESAAAGSETEASASSAASEPSEALSGSLHAASERHTVFSLGGDNSGEESKTHHGAFGESHEGSGSHGKKHHGWGFTHHKSADAADEESKTHHGAFGESHEGSGSHGKKHHGWGFTHHKSADAADEESKTHHGAFGESHEGSGSHGKKHHGWGFTRHKSADAADEESKTHHGAFGESHEGSGSHGKKHHGWGFTRHKSADAADEESKTDHGAFGESHEGPGSHGKKHHGWGFTHHISADAADEESKTHHGAFGESHEGSRSHGKKHHEGYTAHGKHQGWAFESRKSSGAARKDSEAPPGRSEAVGAESESRVLHLTEEHQREEGKHHPPKSKEELMEARRKKKEEKREKKKHAAERKAKAAQQHVKESGMSRKSRKSHERLQKKKSSHEAGKATEAGEPAERREAAEGASALQLSQAIAWVPEQPRWEREIGVHFF